MEIKDVSELLRVLMDSVVEVTHADKGFLLLLRETGPEIAVELQISHETVRTHVRNAMGKVEKHRLRAGAAAV